jgi:hypothetical protein
MKIFGVVGIILSAVLIVWAIAVEVLADYEYTNNIGSYWSLADKASTLEAKSQYLDKFAAAIEAEHLSGYNAIFLKTPDNSVEQNLAVLHTLQTRMREIKGMDVTSFAYQQAIQQITAQEQGEAQELLSVIEGSWYLKNHVFLMELDRRDQMGFAADLRHRIGDRLDCWLGRLTRTTCVTAL